MIIALPLFHRHLSPLFLFCFFSCFVVTVTIRTTLCMRRDGRLLLCLSSVDLAWPDDSLSLIPI